ncbi:small lysine-rich protein 1 isoform X1 [Mirounga leonina]|uniref:small lysine-rich protein 1 isoform X1 n=1 Tax=Mirounga leonina TaxID=9715 RepID=UPI00156BFEA4|nr:small lysine-rich protein 1 isoform X1 [Mirounga leonina]
MGAGAPPSGDAENWALSLYFRIGSPCHTHLPARLRNYHGKGKRGKGQGKSRGKKQKKPEVDILSPAAMLNLYYIAHNVADCLQLRGFRWPGAPKAKKGKNKT